MVSARLAFRLLIALGAIGATRAFHDEAEMLVARDFYDEVEGLSARELGLTYHDAREYDDTVDYSRRGYVDGDDFVLSRRDLAALGVRADDISHVLVIRAPPRSPSPSPSEKARYERQLKEHQDGLKRAIEHLKKAKDRLKAGHFKDDKEKRHWKEEEKSARDMKLYEEEEIENYKKLLKH